jgi:hypothetical protein
MPAPMWGNTARLKMEFCHVVQCEKGHSSSAVRGLFIAQSGHAATMVECPLLRAMRTFDQLGSVDLNLRVGGLACKSTVEPLGPMRMQVEFYNRLPEL